MKKIVALSGGLLMVGTAASVFGCSPLTGLPAPSSHSADRVGVGIGVDDNQWPHKVAVKAGTSVSFGITVKNSGNIPENLGVHASKNPSIALSASLASVPLDPWVSESPNYITNTAPGSLTHSVVTIRVPAGTPPGPHYGVVWATYTPPAGKGISSAVGAGLRQEYDVTP